jgi:transposase
VDAHGKLVLTKRRVRPQGLAFVAGWAPCLLGLEASGSAHDWAREVTKRGPPGPLISPQFVRPSVKGNNNDPNDAEAIGAAVGRPPRRCVPIKAVAQHAMPALHRMRERQIKARTALVNQRRGRRAE